MMLSYRILRMLTMILVQNVSLDMYMYCVMELKSSSCQWLSVDILCCTLEALMPAEGLSIIIVFIIIIIFIFISIFLYINLYLHQLYTQDECSLFKLLFLWDGSSSWIKTLRHLLLLDWINNTIHQINHWPCSVANCVHTNLLGSD